MDYVDSYLFSAIKTRRSIRKYTDDPISRIELYQILMAGLYSPSSRNRRPWELFLVDDPDVLKKMSGCRVGSAKMLEHAQAAIVVLANPELSDVWTEDCSIAMYGMQLVTYDLDLGSCWIQCRLREAPDGRSTTEYLRELLKFPEGYEAEAILSIGVPEDYPDAPELSDDVLRKVHWNTWEKESLDEE